MRSDDENDQAATGELPIVSPVDSRVTISGAELASEAAGADEESILPHWTEAPTGQVPAVLTREAAASEDDPWATVPAPAWREGEADWVAHEEQFDASVLSSESAPEETTRPWEFDSLAPSDADDMVLDTPRPTPSRPARTRRPANANPLAGRSVRGGTQKNVSRATLTGLVFGVLVLVLFKLGTVPTMCLIGAALVAAAAESYAALRKSGVHPATLLGLVATLALSVAAYNKGESALGLVSVLFFFFSVLWYLGAETKVDILDGIAATAFVYVWVGVLGSYAALMISPVNYPDKHGLAFLIGTIILVVANDTSALFIGRTLGKHPLAPSISPGKTIEGAVGGSLVSFVIGLGILPAIHPWTMKGAIVIGAVLAVVVPIGDLFESMVKRTLGVKDMAGWLSGHGGMMDRVDGLLFALPTTYYLVHVLHLG